MPGDPSEDKRKGRRGCRRGRGKPRGGKGRGRGRGKKAQKTDELKGNPGQDADNDQNRVKTLFAEAARTVDPALGLLAPIRSRL